MTTSSTPVNIPARDGFDLSATVFGNDLDTGRVAIISSATAVPQKFYRHYAAALAEAGIRAITYDYRGIGGSRPSSLRGFAAKTRDWGLEDMAGVIDWTRASMKPERLYLIGHSVGGQVTGLLDNVADVDAMITVSAQSGHWRLQGGLQKYAVAFHVHVTLPLAAHVMGYVPWSWFGTAEDLPKDAALEWSRWCRDRDYLLGDETLPLARFADFSAPILAYSFADDSWGTRRAVDAMMAAYPNVERRHVEPVLQGLPKIGHFGFFRPAARNLWDESLSWLDSLDQRPGL